MVPAFHLLQRIPRMLGLSEVVHGHRQRSTWHLPADTMALHSYPVSAGWGPLLTLRKGCDNKFYWRVRWLCGLPEWERFVPTSSPALRYFLSTVWTDVGSRKFRGVQSIWYESLGWRRKSLPPKGRKCIETPSQPLSGLHSQLLLFKNKVGRGICCLF